MKLRHREVKYLGNVVAEQDSQLETINPQVVKPLWMLASFSVACSLLCPFSAPALVTRRLVSDHLRLGKAFEFKCSWKS